MPFVFQAIVWTSVTLLASTVIYICQEKELVDIKDSFKRKIKFSHPPCFMNNTAMIEHMKGKLKLHTRNATGMYYLVEGPHGCGKTTALRYAAEVISDNIVYVAVDQKQDFGRSLANALSIDLGCKETPSTFDPLLETLSVKKECPEKLEDRVKMCLNVLETALKKIQEEGNPAPILIIDHVNLLLDQQDTKEILFMLQGFAKTMADERLLTFYFASSEGKVYNILLEKPVGSRLVIFHDNWELSNEEAVNYLYCQCSSFAPNDTIIEIVDIVGGHFTQLIQVREIFLKEAAINLVDVKNELFFLNVISKLKLLDISETPPTSKTGHALTEVTWSLAEKLLVATDNMIRFGEDNLWKKLSSDEKNKLERAYIFDIDWIRQKITFQSTLVHSYFKEVIEREETDSCQAPV